MNFQIFKLDLEKGEESESESEVAQSCLTLCDPMDCSLPSSSVHGIFQAIVLEKAMASHCSTLIWKIPWAEEPERLQSMGSLRVRYD